MTPLVVIAVALVVAVVVVVVLISRRREPDTLGSFQRQIDALSPAARRPVVDQVQRFEQDVKKGASEASEASETGGGDAGDPDDDGRSHGS